MREAFKKLFVSDRKTSMEGASGTSIGNNCFLCGLMNGAFYLGKKKEKEKKKFQDVT